MNSDMKFVRGKRAELVIRSVKNLKLARYECGS